MQIATKIGGQTLGEKRYEGVTFNVISVTRGWVGVQFPGKNGYVTLQWPLINSPVLPGFLLGAPGQASVVHTLEAVAGSWGTEHEGFCKCCQLQNHWGMIYVGEMCFIPIKDAIRRMYQAFIPLFL